MTTGTAAAARILAIDDDVQLLEWLGQVLRSFGFDAVLESMLEPALAELRRGSFDAVICDLYLPEVKGCAALDRIREIDPDLPVIIATGQATDETALQTLKRGAFDYLAKPFQLVELNHVLGRAIEHRKLQASALLYDASRDLLAGLGGEDLQDRALAISRRVLRAPVAALLADGELRLADDDEELRASLEEIAQAALTGDGVVHRKAAHEAAPVWLGYRLGTADRSLGALVVGRDAEPPFNAADERNGAALAGLLTMALDHRRLNRELRRSLAELRASSDSLRRNRARIRAILDVSHDAVFRLDEGGRIQNLNRMAERLFGRTRSELRDQPFIDLLSDEAGRARMAPVLAENSAAAAIPVITGPFEATIRAAGDQVLAAEISLARTSDGDEVLHTAFVRDVSERRRLEVELRHAQKLESVGLLASGIAHEINTPIQFVGDNVRFLREAWEEVSRFVAALERAVAADDCERPIRREDVGRVAEEIDLPFLREEVPLSLEQTLEGVGRVATIVGAMKDFAHADSRQMTLADMNRGLESTLIVARNELKHVADVETELGKLPPVLCHAGDLNQVFLNLVINAAHAIADEVGGGERGTIAVRTEVDGEDVVISFRDTGGGIPAAIAERIFDPFFTTKEVGKGTGQGLAIARAIVVDKHGGSLTFETEPGRGTTFFVRLPIAGPKRKARMTQSASCASETDEV